jgi:hypothetical protein
MNPDAELAELVARCKEVASLVGEGREVFAECSYCHTAVPLWEALYTQQIAGVLAHIACPEDTLRQVVGEAGPVPEFDYASLVAKVEERMLTPRPTEAAGSIERPSSAPKGSGTD